MTRHVNRIILSSILEIAPEYSNTDSVVSRVYATPPEVVSSGCMRRIKYTTRFSART